MESKQSVQNQETSGIPEDLRAAMESPEVKAFDARLSKKYLKNNRPKSLVVVILLVGAVLLLLGLSSHKASSVTPAEEKVDISRIIADAASRSGIASAAPVPSPRRRSKFRSAFFPNLVKTVPMLAISVTFKIICTDTIDAIPHRYVPVIFRIFSICHRMRLSCDP